MPHSEYNKNIAVSVCKNNERLLSKFLCQQPALGSIEKIDIALYKLLDQQTKSSIKDTPHTRSHTSTMQSTLTIPKVQSAWKVVGRGHPTKAVVFDKNDPVPSDLKPGEVLVKVQAAAFNPM